MATGIWHKLGSLFASLEEQALKAQKSSLFWMKSKGWFKRGKKLLLACLFCSIGVLGSGWKYWIFIVSCLYVGKWKLAIRNYRGQEACLCVEGNRTKALICVSNSVSPIVFLTYFGSFITGIYCCWLLIVKMSNKNKFEA